jgi:glycosyltransferase involved in cell wall biosynthesis
VKILISSHAFPPSIGGIEMVGALLANEFVKLGHDITVVTQTSADSAPGYSYPIIRKPSVTQLWHAAKWCDIFWHNNLSLRTLWPAAFLRKPVVITHHGSYCRKPEGLDLVQRLKHMVVTRYRSIAVSEAVARCFRTPSAVIPGPFDTTVFRSGREHSEHAMLLLLDVL